ncbi:MAG: IS110 family transposase [Candidatus Brocadiia bacterium]
MGKCNVSQCGNKSEQIADDAGDHPVSIGMDVHKKSVHVAVCIDGQITSTFVIGGGEGPCGTQAVISSLESLKSENHRIVYEAGPTGYELARRLQQEGFNAWVIAPGKTPREANQGNKSDQMDAADLAYYLDKDMLTKVSIPTRQEEADRQVTRLREQLQQKLSCVKNQIKGFLLQHNIAEPEGLSRWSNKAVKELSDIELSEELQFSLNMLLEELKAMKQRLRKVNKKIREMSRSDRYREKARIAQTHPGVGEITSMTFLTEIFRPGRFDVPGSVSKYSGLAPHVRETGGNRIEGGRLPGGRKGLRRLLVQAAWVWIRHDPWAREKYKHLLSNTGESNKAIVAMALRMVVNLWCMVTRGEEYIQGGTRQKKAEAQ